MNALSHIKPKLFTALKDYKSKKPTKLILFRKKGGPWQRNRYL